MNIIVQEFVEKVSLFLAYEIVSASSMQQQDMGLVPGVRKGKLPLSGNFVITVGKICRKALFLL